MAFGGIHSHHQPVLLTGNSGGVRQLTTGPTTGTINPTKHFVNSSTLRLKRAPKKSRSAIIQRPAFVVGRRSVIVVCQCASPLHYGYGPRHLVDIVNIEVSRTVARCRRSSPASVGHDRPQTTHSDRQCRRVASDSPPPRDCRLPPRLGDGERDLRRRTGGTIMITQWPFRGYTPACAPAVAHPMTQMSVPRQCRSPISRAMVWCCCR